MPLSPFQVNDDLHLRRVWEQTGLGYGYQTWVFDDPRAMFGLLGAFGQAIYVDPGSRLVMVHTAVRTRPSDPTWKRWRCGAAWWPRWVRADNNPPELQGSGVSRSR